MITKIKLRTDQTKVIAPPPLLLPPIQQAIVATVSDDETWKVWSVPNCDLLMSGEGHRDWVSGVTFHPHGTMLATSAGDNTVKIWDFLQVGQPATCLSKLL